MPGVLVSIGLWFADVVRNRTLRRRRVTVLAHRAYFVGGSDEMCFVSVTNRSPTRPVTVTHVWFATTPEKDVLVPERPLPKTLGPDEVWATWCPTSTLPTGKTPVELLARVAITGSDRPIKSRANRHVRPVGYIPGAGTHPQFTHPQFPPVSTTSASVVHPTPDGYVPCSTAASVSGPWAWFRSRKRLPRA